MVKYSYVAMMLTSFLLAQLWLFLQLPASRPELFGMQFYQHVLGHLDGRHCSSYPVCSQYAKQALSEHGWMLGSWLVVDRLIHEGGDLHSGSSKWVVMSGEQRLFDPLSRNDFWLRRE